MNLLSEIISKPVLNLYSGKIEGTIKDAYFDSAYKKIQYFKIFDEDEEEYLINTNKIYSVGSTCLVIRNSEALTLENTQNLQDNNPVNLEIYSSAGDKLGMLCDVELEDNFEIKNFITKDMVINPKNIVNIGKIIVINNTNKKIRCSDFKPKMKKTKQNEKSNIIKIMPIINEPSNEDNNSQINSLLPTIETQTPQIVDNNKISQDISSSTIESNVSQSQPTPQPQKNTFKIYNEPTPQRIVGNGNFLIGRKVIKTIYGLNNEIIIKKDNIINAKNLESAKKHSKLVELTVFSKIKA